jgi:multiple sugar transport system substrate-binding protein
MGDSGGMSPSRRRGRTRIPVRVTPARTVLARTGSRWRLTASLASAMLAAGALAACGSSGGGSGPVTLNFYQYPDVSGATSQEVKNCNQQAQGKYKISWQVLPAAADSQRLQLVRRMAAHDNTIDIMGLDVTWEAEFANAGWIEPWTGADKAAVVNGTLKPALDTAIWKGQLVAAPANTNTQLLWYRSDLVKTPPKTWAQMIADAEQLAKEGKPHYIEIQGAQYEGNTVWFNTMLNSAGGTVLNPSATKVALGAPAVKALSIMKQLADSPAADPSLAVQMEDQNRLAMEGGTAAFELNYPYVYPSMKADNPKMFKNFKWALYPSVIPGVPAKVTIGGIDLAVSSFSQHKSLAFQAALCLRNKQNQLIGATVGGVPPTIASLYRDPKMFADYPFHADILYALSHGSVRPKTPLYQVVSIDISHLTSPPVKINPVSTEKAMAASISNALQSKGLVP